MSQELKDLWNMYKPMVAFSVMAASGVTEISTIKTDGIEPSFFSLFALGLLNAAAGQLRNHSLLAGILLLASAGASGYWSVHEYGLESATIPVILVPAFQWGLQTLIQRWRDKPDVQ